jgi:hypothetical protein
VVLVIKTMLSEMNTQLEGAPWVVDVEGNNTEQINEAVRV